ARVSVEEAKAHALAARDAVQAVTGLGEWPEDVSSVAGLALQLGGGRLVFTDEAFRSLAKSDFAKCGDGPTIIWQCLRAMTNELHGLVMQQLSAQQVADEFRKRSKFELT